MNYKLSIAPNGVTVDRISDREARMSSLITALIAFAIALTGFIFFASSGFSTESETSFTVMVFAGVLCIGFLIHATIASWLLKPLPDCIFFNNDRSVIEIKHKASITKKIEIPYNDVHTIEPRTVSTWDSSSKRSRIRYAVTMYLKDGSLWDLIEDSIIDSSAASDYAAKIMDNTSLGKESLETVIIPEPNTHQLSVVKRGDEIQIRWRNHNPASMSRQLSIPILIIAISMFMSLSGEADEWGILIDTLKTKNYFVDLAKLPELLGGLIFTVGIIFICMIVLLVQVIRIVRFRLKANKIVINNSLMTSSTDEDFSIPTSTAGNACIAYRIGEKHIRLEIMRHVPSFKAESTEFKGDLTLKTVMSMVEEDFKAALKETFSKKDNGIPNTLVEFSFDRFSPLDVYVVKECIKQKLQLKE